MRTRLTRAEGKAQTRARLLDAAARLFARRGYQGTSVENVAQSAGYTIGALYSNFTGKEQLFLALYDRHTETNMARIEQAVNAEDPQLDPARALVEAFSEALRDRDWCLLSFEFWLSAARNAAVRRRLLERVQTQNERIGRLVERWCDEAGLRLAVPPEEAAAMVAAVVDGLSLQHLVDRTIQSDALVRGVEAVVVGLSEPRLPQSSAQRGAASRATSGDPQE